MSDDLPNALGGAEERPLPKKRALPSKLAATVGENPGKS
jgi:hypothetical protein